MIAYLKNVLLFSIYRSNCKTIKKMNSCVAGDGTRLPRLKYLWLEEPKKIVAPISTSFCIIAFLVAMSRQFDSQSKQRNKLVNRDRFETSSFASFFILCGGRLACYRKYITLQSKIHHGQPLNLSFPNLSKLMLCCWMIFIHTIHNVTHQQNRDFASRTTAYYNIFVSSKSKNTDHVRSLM